MVTEPHAIVGAIGIAQEYLEQLDAVASRFRPDSQLSQLNAAARHSRVDTIVSPILGDMIVAALQAAELTDGLVTPTVGHALDHVGYDADITEVQQRTQTPDMTTRIPDRPNDWRSVRYCDAERRLQLPQGTSLDLGSTAKAAAADAIAARLARSLPGGFLVNLGGDIAVDGIEPDSGWPVAVENHHGTTLQVVAGHRNAFATSSTQKRAWMHNGSRRHHIIDPRTGYPCKVVWSQATCAADTALVANAASTAALILGERAPAWLEDLGIPARLDPLVGPATMTAGWPDHDQAVAA